MNLSLFLHSLTLVQYRNYGQKQLVFPQRIIGITGPNGSGKTTLLDAIYYLCFTKSRFARSDSQVMQQGYKGFRVEGEFQIHNSPTTVCCILRETLKKECLWNEEQYSKLSAHIGRIPCVMIAPDDATLITEGSEERRKFLDGTLSQLDHDYLDYLLLYNKVLAQRNQYLKQVADQPVFDLELLQIYDSQLAKAGDIIHQKRKVFLETFIPKVLDLYVQIAGKQEPLSIQYNSELLYASQLQLLQQSQPKDRLLQRTTQGIHRDDLELLYSGEPFRQAASQGQRKSLLFALKFAEWEILREQMNLSPILLLDDVFEKLDGSRMNNLLHRVAEQYDAQVFITDTHKERLENCLRELNISYHAISTGHE